eukprot:01038.XXX_3167_3325_1 [CDS] Oithona nana genome sequencing.
MLLLTQFAVMRCNWLPHLFYKLCRISYLLVLFEQFSSYFSSSAPITVFGIFL